MVFGGTSNRVLDYSLTAVQFMGKSQIKLHRKVPEGTGLLGGTGGGKWDENKSR